jgi:DNA polymerase III sliding clamp (beta) subunit (PCNA family)
MARLKVQGHMGLVRDSISKAVINTNKEDYQEYMRRAKSREMQRDSLTDAIKEINSLKQELFEIKKLIREKE